MDASPFGHEYFIVLKSKPGKGPLTMARKRRDADHQAADAGRAAEIRLLPITVENLG
jgi:hypothetical protein